MPTLNRTYWATVVKPDDDGMFTLPKGWRLHSVTGDTPGLIYVLLEPDV